jgi:hypothetical protein
MLSVFLVRYSFTVEDEFNRRPDRCVGLAIAGLPQGTGLP